MLGGRCYFRLPDDCRPTSRRTPGSIIISLKARMSTSASTLARVRARLDLRRLKLQRIDVALKKRRIRLGIEIDARIQHLMGIAIPSAAAADFHAGIITSGARKRKIPRSDTRCVNRRRQRSSNRAHDNLPFFVSELSKTDKENRARQVKYLLCRLTQSVDSPVQGIT